MFQRSEEIHHSIPFAEDQLSIIDQQSVFPGVSHAFFIKFFWVLKTSYMGNEKLATGGVVTSKATKNSLYVNKFI